MRKKETVLLLLFFSIILVSLQSCIVDEPYRESPPRVDGVLDSEIVVQNEVTQGEIRVKEVSVFDIRTIASSINNKFVVETPALYVKQNDVLWALHAESEYWGKNREPAILDDYIFYTHTISLMITPNFTGNVWLFFTRSFKTGKITNATFTYGDSLSTELKKLATMNTTKPEDFITFSYEQEDAETESQFIKNLVQAAINATDPRVLIIERADENSSLKITSFDEGGEKVLDVKLGTRRYFYEWVFTGDRLKQFEKNGLMKVNRE